MNSPLPPGFDLSKLPEPLRSKLQAQLDRLSPELREKFAERGSPILQKAIDRAKDASTPIARAQQARASWPRHGDGRYSATVQPGDRVNVSLTMIAMVVAAVVALYFLNGG